MVPFQNEVASGESLIWLENSRVLKDFEGVILQKEKGAPVSPPVIQVDRNNWWPRRVIAIDGSHLIKRVNNGYPGAEAGLLLISVVALKLEQLKSLDSSSIPSPAYFRNLENVCTLEEALPGIGVVQKGIADDSPVNFFRRKLYDTLSNPIANNHETLLETMRSICLAANFKNKIDCPINDCSEEFNFQQGEYKCVCGREESIFESDILRLHEYFDGIRTGGEALGRLRSAVEVLVLINILRFFIKECPEYLESCAFVLDGPLALFGTPASILRPIRKELKSLNNEARKINNKDIVLFGIQKKGQFTEHWNQLDWDDDNGPGARFSEQTVIALNHQYIKENILPTNKNGKPFGTDTHFGRIIMYKSKRQEHIVLHTAMMNKKAENLNDNSIECYPRLGDILDVIDQLGTYLYKDGFWPIVRAHANAAIPLKRGEDIIKRLLED